MQTVILAAGTGSRLKNLTTELPKALVPVAGKPLLAYAIRFAKEFGADDIIVVTGKFKEKVEAFLKRVAAPGLRWIHNPQFLLGNLYSLGAARPWLQGDFLLMNIDHIYGQGIARLVRKQAQDLTAFCDQDRALGDDDMKVDLAVDGRLRAISKTLTTFQRGYVGMTFCGGSHLATYLESFDRVASRSGDKAVVEMILADLAERGQAPRVGDISGVGWLEIDTADERDRAEAAIRQDPDRYPTLE
jgi:choline kinase